MSYCTQAKESDVDERLMKELPPRAIALMPRTQPLSGVSRNLDGWSMASKGFGRSTLLVSAADYNFKPHRHSDIGIDCCGKEQRRKNGELNDLE